MAYITAKLGNMRKAVEFTVCPAVSGHEDDTITIQSDKRIAMFNVNTGEGVVSDGKGGHPGFHKLSKVFGAIDIKVSQDIIDAAMAGQPKKGDMLGGGLMIVG